ncbi:Uncharacterized protein Anas_04551 [Armadillidium nasatum]|uniref:Uncharacterized protein n=1 Tax=Armadillidium nasatum TaxID=96803 RepID=A0A5N5SVU8_9CRUS|nr:Uncharacterized protein Anas_04551 [Armadillidium nasatum]
MCENIFKVSSEGFLYLSSDPIRFEPVSKVTNVFFDEANKEVLSVRGRGTLGVVVKGEGRTSTFCMDHKGSISSIKFSPDHTILALQRTNTSVELLSYNDGELSLINVQECRSKGANVLGFIWSHNDHLLLVTDHAVEFYQVIKEKSSIRYMKSYSQNTRWFVWSPECQILLLCTLIAPTSATLQPFVFSPGQIIKLPKFEAEMSGSTGSQHGSDGTLLLTERDVCVATLYGHSSVLVLRHPSSPTLPAHLDVYSQGNIIANIQQYARDGIFKKTHICLLELTGKFAVNIIDSLIVVHHQASKSSLLFDILLGKETCQGGIISVYPVTLPSSIKPFSLEEPRAVPVTTPVPLSIPCQLYAPTWVVFQPDIIIDARLGCMWKLNIDLEVLPGHVEDKAQLMGECVSGGNGLVSSEGIVGSVIIDQAEIYSSVFAPISEAIDKREQTEKNESGKLTTHLMVGVVLEYIRSLSGAGITVLHFINELVINGLVKTGQFYQLHQLLQYHVLADSKPLACLLLSLVGVYSAAEQLSLDMLSRLNTAHDEITEVLLSHKLVIQARSS